MKREFSVFREQFSGNPKSQIQHLKFFAKRMLGKSTLLKSHAEALRKNFPSAGILAIDKESTEWDHIRTGKPLHEFAIANFEGQPGPYVLMVDEVQGGFAA